MSHAFDRLRAANRRARTLKARALTKYVHHNTTPSAMQSLSDLDAIAEAKRRSDERLNRELHEQPPAEFVTKDSGDRATFTSGMVRDTAAGKADYTRVLEGPLLDRWAALLVRGAQKYPDLPDGRANWTLADGPEELRRFRESAARHLVQWLRGERDEDHAAAVVFNLNGAEYVLDRMAAAQSAAAAGTDVPQ